MAWWTRIFTPRLTDTNRVGSNPIIRLMKPIVIVESPYAGDVERNTAYARAALRDCLGRGEAPFASHLLYTQVLDDTVPDERLWGIESGFAFRAAAQLTAVYTDLGISRGMELGIKDAQAKGNRIEYRSLPGWTNETLFK